MSKVNMRGWDKMSGKSTQVSTVAKFRETLAAFTKHVADSEKCMWEFRLCFAPDEEERQ